MEPQQADRLPHRENARVAPEKARYYIDEKRRSDPDSKVGVFRDRLGFTDERLLQAALIVHAQSYRAVVYRARPNGIIWNVEGPLAGPSGRSMVIRSGWMIENGSTTPTNTTAFPGDPGLA